MKIHNHKYQIMHVEYLEVDNHSIPDEYIVKPYKPRYNDCYDDYIYPIFSGRVYMIENEVISRVVIDHGNFYFSSYGNLEYTYVYPNDIVYEDTKIGKCYDNVLYFNMVNEHGIIPNMFNHDGIRVCRHIPSFHHDCNHHHYHPPINICGKNPPRVLETLPDGTIYDYIYKYAIMRIIPSRTSDMVCPLYEGNLVTYNGRDDKIINQGVEWIYVTNTSNLSGYVPKYFLSSTHYR